MVASGLQSQQQMLDALQWIDPKHCVFLPYLLRYRSPRFNPLRTTDAAMGFVRNLITTDPVTSMTVINNNVNAPQFGTQQ